MTSAHRNSDWSTVGLTSDEYVEEIPEDFVEESDSLRKHFWDGNCSIWKNPIGFPVVFFIAGIIAIIILNIILISRAPEFDSDGAPIHPHRQWSAIILLTGMTVVLAVFYLAFLYYFCRDCYHEYDWLCFVVTFLALFVIAVATAAVGGYWLDLGFLWAPTSIPDETIHERRIRQGTRNG